MKKYFITMILLTTSLSFIWAEQGKYTRKSISSLESVWIKNGALQGLSNFDYTTFDKFIDFYVEVERFDYNVLPESMLDDFRSQANSIANFSIDDLAEVLEKTVVEKIIAILNDPDVMHARASSLKDESKLQSFAATKAKSMGLTADELGILMNSAYIYLPYINSMIQLQEGSKVQSTIQGGLIWWQIKTATDGTVSIDRIVEASTIGVNTINKDDKHPVTGEPKYKKFKFGAEEWATSPEQYSQNDAMLAFAKNLGVKTKSIDAFKLTAQIAEADGRKYGFPLGFREGLHLDDGLNIVEYSEDLDGNEIAEVVGFVRVSKTGDNIENPAKFSYAKQLLGPKQSVGGVVMEHPRLGIDVKVKFGMISGLSIPKEDMPIGVKEDVDSAFGTDIFFSYNLAPIVGISQLFFDLNTTLAYPSMEIEKSDNSSILEDPTATPFLLSVYGGVSKKLWFGSANLGIFAGAGLESLNVRGKTPWNGSTGIIMADYIYSVRALGIKISADFEKLVTPDVSLNLGVQYKIAPEPTQISYTVDGTEDINLTGTGVSTAYPNLDLSGLGYNIGINYSLGELPFNLFGFLDPFKKH